MFDEYKDKTIIFKLFGDIESQLEKAKEEVLKISNGTISLDFTQKNLDIKVELSIENCKDVNVIDQVVKDFISTFSPFIYADDDSELNKNAVDLLKLSRRSLCSAESFTGGLVSKSIVEIPGASEVFYEGFVTYNTRSKEEILGVSHDTVRTRTVVSEEVAFQMVRGLLSSEHCDVGIATTGYASPTGDPQKPCGLCFVACGMDGKVEVRKHQFFGSRQEIMEKGKNAVLFLLNKMLRE